MKKEKKFNDHIIVLFIIFGIPFIAVFFLFRSLINIIYSPFEKAKYKNSDYYKKHKIPYKIGITSYFDYELYNFAKSLGCNFEKKASLLDRYHYYIFNQTIVLPSWFEDYEQKNDSISIIRYSYVKDDAFEIDLVDSIKNEIITVENLENYGIVITIKDQIKSFKLNNKIFILNYKNKKDYFKKLSEAIRDNSNSNLSIENKI